MWDLCSEQDLFKNLDNDDFEKVKSIFETNIENYKTHILQTNGETAIVNVLISNIKKEIKNESRQVETRQDISNMRKQQIDSDFENKQNEFNSLLSKKPPKNLDFSDDKQDEPLGADNLEVLIKEQLKDRELNIPTPSTETNSIVSGNQFTQTHTNEINQEPAKISRIEEGEIKDDKNVEPKLEMLMNENEKLVSEISKLSKQINSQNDAIHKILSSQILILKKLK
tara:strand:+ start:25959 stop:26636 length:678 start_codon:yes stop_codon:yes gene_type:complete